MFDLVLEGRRVLLTHGIAQAAIGIRDGIITAVMAPGSEAVEARQRVDAGDRLVMPGLIDCHVHFREPGMAHKEGFTNGTRAAAAGGVTTVLVQPTDQPITFTPDDVCEKEALANKIYVDVGIQAAVGRDLSLIPKLAELGVVSFEIFIADSNASLRLDDGDAIIAALRSVKETGRIAGVTPGEHTVIKSLIATLQGSGAKAPKDFPRAFPPAAEAMGLARAAVAALETGTEVVFRQTSCRASVDTLRQLQRLGPNLHAETNPQYLFLTEAAFATFGPFAVMSPPLRTDEDVSALWQGLSDGTLSVISTDHAPHLPQEKLAAAADVWTVPRGAPGLQTMLPLMLAAAAAGRCSYQDIARWCAERPARMFGLYPRKGAIILGADADLVVIDTADHRPIDDASQLSLAVRTPFAGQHSGGAVKLVLLRGEVLAEDGRVADRPRGRIVRAS
jgi:dihydroorotase